MSNITSYLWNIITDYFKSFINCILMLQLDHKILVLQFNLLKIDHMLCL